MSNYTPGTQVEVCLNRRVSSGEWQPGIVLAVGGAGIRVRYPAPYPDTPDYESWFAEDMVRIVDVYSDVDPHEDNGGCNHYECDKCYSEYCNWCEVNCPDCGTFPKRGD